MFWLQAEHRQAAGQLYRKRRKFGGIKVWRKKVWQISPRILVVYNISYMLANKVWRNITIRQIRQTFVVYGIRCF